MGSGVTCYDAPRNRPQRCHTLVCDVNNIAKQRHITSLWWSPGMPRVVSKSMRIIADIAIADNPLAHYTHAGQRFPGCRHESHPSRWTGCSTIGVHRRGSQRDVQPCWVCRHSDVRLFCACDTPPFAHHRRLSPAHAITSPLATRCASPTLPSHIDVQLVSTPETRGLQR